MARQLQAIFFDIDDTLFSTSVFAEKARRNAVDAMLTHGLKADRELLLRELHEVIQEFSANYDKHFDKLLARLPARSLDGVNADVIIASGMMAYHDTKFRDLRVYDDVYEVLEALSKTDLIRGIISAGLSKKQAEKLLRLHIYAFLSPQAIFITEQIGISKPNPKLYQSVLDRLGLDADKTMYVGDNPRHDVDPCNSLGMITVFNRRSGRHIREKGETEPDFVVGDFYELREILRSEFGVAL
ncbi:MAG: HAD-IA family hydrolase [Planctomycetota bacterium]